MNTHAAALIQWGVEALLEAAQFALKTFFDRPAFPPQGLAPRPSAWERLRDRLADWTRILEAWLVKLSQRLGRVRESLFRPVGTEPSESGDTRTLAELVDDLRRAWRS